LIVVAVVEVVLVVLVVGQIETVVPVVLVVIVVQVCPMLMEYVGRVCPFSRKCMWLAGLGVTLSDNRK
jgi:hypothetical protein